MPEEVDEGRVVKDLKRALAAGGLDERVVHLAEQCLARLEGTVRLSVIGPEVCDATAIANFLASRDLLGRDSGACLVRLVHRENREATAFYGEKRQEKFVGTDIAKVFQKEPRLVELGAETPALKKLTIVRAAREAMSDLEKAAAWAAPASDIVLWSTREFSEAERDIWMSLPDKVRAHAYLVLPRRFYGADRVRERAEGLFSEVLSIDAAAASAARGHPSGVDKAAFRDAGGTQMVKTIKREIEAIRRAALDAAQVVLIRDVPAATAGDTRAYGRTISRLADRDGGAAPTTRPLPRPHLVSDNPDPIVRETSREVAQSHDASIDFTSSRKVEENSPPDTSEAAPGPSLDRTAMPPAPTSRIEDMKAPEGSAPKGGFDMAASAVLDRPVTPWSMDLPVWDAGGPEMASAALRAAERSRPTRPITMSRSRPFSRNRAISLQRENERMESTSHVATRDLGAIHEDLHEVYNHISSMFASRAKMVTQQIQNGDALDNTDIIDQLRQEVSSAHELVAEGPHAKSSDGERILGLLVGAEMELTEMMERDDAEAAVDGACLLLDLRRQLLHFVAA